MAPLEIGQLSRFVLLFYKMQLVEVGQLTVKGSDPDYKSVLSFCCLWMLAVNIS
jgi:hypothetical protein